MEKTKNKNLFKKFYRDLMNVENIIFDVCSNEITKGKAITDIMNLIYKTNEKKNN